MVVDTIGVNFLEKEYGYIFGYEKPFRYSWQGIGKKQEPAGSSGERQVSGSLKVLAINTRPKKEQGDVARLIDPYLEGMKSVGAKDEARRYTLAMRLYCKDKESFYLAIVTGGMRVLEAMYGERSEGEGSGMKKLCVLGQTLVELSRSCRDYNRILYWGDMAWPRMAYGDEAHEKNLRLLYGAVERYAQCCAIRREPGSPLIVIYLIALSIGIFSLDPCWRTAVEACGIDYDRLCREFPRYACMIRRCTCPDKATGACAVQPHVAGAPGKMSTRTNRGIECNKSINNR